MCITGWVVTAFWLERSDSRIQRAVDGIRKLFGNASETKHFELHGKVQRCLLASPDAELKATLTHNTSSFIDTVLNGLARIFGRAGINIEPPNRLEDTLWEMTSPKLQDLPMHEAEAMQRSPSTILGGAERRIQAFRSGTNGCSGIVGFAVTTDASGSGVAKRVKPQGAGGSPSLVSSQIETRDREEQAATKIQRAFSAHVTKTLTQASDGLRALLSKMSATQIHSHAELRVGDVIVAAPAQNGPKANEWEKHGFVYQVVEIGTDKFRGNQSHLIGELGRSKDARTFGVLPAVNYVKGFEVVNHPERGKIRQPIRAPVETEMYFVSESNLEQPVAKIQHLADKGVVYKMASSCSYKDIEEQFEKAAASNHGKSYSRQNNCNHAIYATLSALHSRGNEHAATQPRPNSTAAGDFA